MQVKDISFQLENSDITTEDESGWFVVKNETEENNAIIVDKEDAKLLLDVLRLKNVCNLCTTFEVGPDKLELTVSFTKQYILVTQVELDTKKAYRTLVLPYAATQKLAKEFKKFL